MEKTRVLKGEKYWYITFNIISAKFIVDCDIEGNFFKDAHRFEEGNYYLSRDEAEQVKIKLHAVLKGADVIEIPSEEEVKNEESRMNPYTDTLQGSRYVDGFFDAIKYLKSKIVK